MVVSKKLLTQWVNIIDISDEDIAKALNNLGFEVEKVINLTKINTHLIVGQITAINKHPRIERLNICDVNIGKGNLRIVCGANNIAVGLKVIVAQIGAALGNGMEIILRDLQGVTSQGMICSLTELGLHKDVQSPDELLGIVHLPDNAVVGSTNPLSFLELDDTIFEIQLTINRSDCLAMYSIAQELSSYFKIALTPMGISDLAKLKNETQFNINNSLINALASLRIKLGDSVGKISLANSIRRTLQLANIKPTNFFDDLVNLVMLELGQPILVFNGDILQEPAIFTSPKEYPSESGLKILVDDITLNDKYLAFSTLGLQTLEEYQVQDNSTNIFIASINPEVISMQAQIKRHNSIASTVLLQRLNKPVVPDYYLVVLQRVLFLLSKFKINYQVLNFTNDIKFEPKISKTTFKWKKINDILGTDLGLAQIINSLKLIGCKIIQDAHNHEILHIEAPSHRNDLNNINDFSEEIARIMGYDNLPVVRPKININLQEDSLLIKLMNNFRAYLINNGFNQVKTYSLTNKNSIKDFNFFNYEIPITLMAPLTSAREVMRLSLVESLVEIYQTNLVYKQKNLNFFCDDVIYTGDEQPDQHHLAFLVSKDFLPKSVSINTNNFYLAKGILEALLNNKFGHKFSAQWTYEKIKSNKVHPYLSTNIKYNQIHFASIVKLHPEIIRQLNLNDDFFLVEINCSRLQEILEKINENKRTKFIPWSKFNPLSRDISITINSDISFMKIKQEILNQKIKNLIDVSLVDIYSDEKLQQEESHALTFNLKFNSNEEQLTEAKIAQSIDEIQNLVKENFSAKLR